MGQGVLLLGPVLFQDFELPERVRWGGGQRLAVHRLPGGVRVIDAMGRDDAEIMWCGVFSGPDAGLRARSLDLMRADGSPWPLTWDWFFYTVVIARFEADYAKANWIPYRIVCTVVRDEAAAVVDATISLAASVLGDLSAAGDFDSGVALDGATGALAVPGATQPGSAAYDSAATAVAAASAQIDSGIAGTEAQLTGTSVADAAGLGTTAGLAGTLAALTGARGYVLRAGVNLGNAEQ